MLKSKSSLVLLALVAFASSLVAQEKSQYSWSFSKAEVDGTAVKATDASGKNVITFATGARIDADAKAPGGKVVVLDGTQEDSGNSSRNLAPLNAVQIELRFKPTGEGPDRQTLVSLSAAYELRYLNNRSAVEFIVFTADKKFTIVRQNIQPKAWNYATATFVDGKVTLAIGKAAKDTMLPAGATVEPKQTRLRVGRQGDRVFNGAISELSIKEL